MWLLLTPSWLYKRMKIILNKKSQGQPVSFTDFFGYLIGETILKDVSFTSTQIPLSESNLVTMQGHLSAEVVNDVPPVNMSVGN